MVTRVETGERPERDGQAWEVVEVDEPLIAAVAERVTDRRGPHVMDLDVVQGRASLVR